jgi:nucleotide-binding universal stress UspA family protein
MIPLARGLTRPAAGKLIFLRVVEDPAEMPAEHDYLTDYARQNGAELRYVISKNPAAAIKTELEREPRAIAALTTHGRTAWTEAIIGSVAFRVLRESMRPVLLFRPHDKGSEAPNKITRVTAALDGSAFSEKILPYAVRAARSLSAHLFLVQALPVHQPRAISSDIQKSDILESSYVHRLSVEIQVAHGLQAQWEVLHGEPVDALCRYLKDMPETLLAMTTHAHPAAKRVVLGSIAAACVRHAGVPLLLYWPSH